MVLYTIVYYLFHFYLRYRHRIFAILPNRCRQILTNVVETMDSMIESYLGAVDTAQEPDDIPKGCADTVWILGKSYSPVQELELIRRDIQTRIWCTYRRGFVPIGSPQLTSDKGWGCMLRCGQMVLAQSLLDLHLGRDWFWTPETRDPTYLKIVNRFEDNRKSPFSIHQIALMGNSEDKKVGEWFGPNTVAQVLKKLLKYDDWSSLSIHVALDNVIYLDDIKELCCDDEDKSWKPLLLIVPLRLGINEINPIYIDGLKRCFEINRNMGMIGGKPNQALYFIGYVGDEVLYLDPHTTQRNGSVGGKETAEEIEMDETFHQKYASRIPFRQMDPSLAVCFLCRTQLEFDELYARLLQDVLSGSHALFEVIQTRQQPWPSVASTSATTSHRRVRNRGESETDPTLGEFEELDVRQSDEDFEIIT
ncbi:cysteine protease ATG4B [Phlebotomus argentipes]|uniref:cysteine protease ATG4B n=1 Tax=Phlebotomus argentipes TaxID=94469 RepID=UPI00289357F2|nr:cysteine protease ATG4B [Phlebotomus argentipes]